MYNAFQKLGCEIKLLQAQQNKRKKRRKAVAEISKWLDRNQPDLCYIESPSGPILNLCDLRLIKKIHKMGIPCSYFYRDACFKFPRIFISHGIGALKAKIIALLSNRDIKFLEKNVDLVYFPTATMSKYFDFTKTSVLPPACIGNLADKSAQINERKSIYVGGLSKRYGTDTMLSAFDILNADGVNYPLTIICRISEMPYISEEYLNKPWLTIDHVSGKDNLKEKYALSNLGLCPIQKNEYNNFALSVKLFEYMEFGLPVVAVNSTETAKFIREFSTGLVCEDNPRDFAEKVRKILSDQQTYSAYTKQVFDAVNSGNRWVDRAQTVLNDFDFSKEQAESKL
jgi:glycosyltransferase involved in cell wall biosynthesis